MPELHEALCDYLNRVRGTSAVPGNVVICNGYGQDISLLIQVLVQHGARRIALEDPSSNDDARVLAGAAGLDVVGMGPDGVQADALHRADADGVVLTPSHQWPTRGSAVGCGSAGWWCLPNWSPTSPRQRCSPTAVRRSLTS
ncbi:hypothetical protein [Nonomuraea sp. SYSU D8015]|uniref:hypothetical protein n=1 Tax=Nonomuraea sp. SYSU D8015 TaxID=2593644 RepID=UPI001CB6C001|nr:hypothetical protein [Nonomuraea sp. SYSU D8015]